jgi:hypothetical protein
MPVTLESPDAGLSNKRREVIIDMNAQNADREVPEAFASTTTVQSATPCAVYLANASNAGCLGDAIESHFGSVAADFYRALVQIAKANCPGGASS